MRPPSAKISGKREPAISFIPPLAVGLLPNGALPRAVLYLDTLHARLASAKSKLIHARVNHEEHVIALHQHAGAMYAYDGYLGGSRFTEGMSARHLNTWILSQYKRAAEHSAFIARERQLPSYRQTLEIVQRLSTLIDPRRFPTPYMLITQAGPRYVGLSFSFKDLLYFYAPQHGTSVMRVNQRTGIVWGDRVIETARILDAHATPTRNPVIQFHHSNAKA